MRLCDKHIPAEICLSHNPTERTQGIFGKIQFITIWPKFNDTKRARIDPKFCRHQQIQESFLWIYALYKGIQSFCWRTKAFWLNKNVF